MSDDGSLAIVVIAMVGNPFSPEYFRARRRGGASALHHAAMNVALYGRRRGLLSPGTPSAFALDEGPIPHAFRTAGGLRIGRSTMAWEGDRLVVDLDERTTELGVGRPRPVRGRIVITPEAMPGLDLPIDEHGQHRWWPVAPLARIDVALREPAVRFSGHGYHDANAGEVGLERSFDRWSWSRARLPRGAGAALTYDVRCRSGATRTHAFRVAGNGDVDGLGDTWTAPLERSAWGLDRVARVDRGASARLVRSLEDGPFYTRSLVETRLRGAPVLAMHESLAGDRLRQAWVRFCTAYRMRTPTRG
ncbi:MAG TPA: carotenoid 1,2-hydratase [Polyangiaceae bacterium LLY-WYZ-14_1]|nr:carotenoid 1,2-hydratase [Polyangiaceae bacterium LLY-WYZ-14_1]